MIRKIESIGNLGIFRNFVWDSHVKEAGQAVQSFQDINIIYGRNYAGKTTISNLVRALEVGNISPEYGEPNFTVSIKDKPPITPANLTGHQEAVRVFNRDFINENILFIVDPDSGIKPFAILGKGNSEIQQDLLKKEEILGSAEPPKGLNGALAKANQDLQTASNTLKKATDSLEKQLRSKATDQKTGIKYLFNEMNYSIARLKTDIKTVTEADYKPLTQNIRSELQLRQNAPEKTAIPEIPILGLKYSSLRKETEELLQRTLSPAKTIKDLLDNASLQEWVHQGIKHHRDKRETCGFCGSQLPSDLWNRLDKHFIKDSEEFRISIQKLINDIKNEKDSIENRLSCKADQFYEDQINQLEPIFDSWSNTIKQYKDSLTILENALSERKNNIFKTVTLPESLDVSETLDNLRDEFNEIIKKAEERTNKYQEIQASTKKQLVLDAVYQFITDIKYDDILTEIEVLEGNRAAHEETSKKLAAETASLNNEITSLRNSLKDESKGAERVNDYLNHFFGHQALKLKSIDNGDRFEVMRDGNVARKLSEGECSLIAFCYFIAKLEDTQTQSIKPIIWIDDPISSLDSNHIYFIFSLITEAIILPGRFKQIFISTHNLDFLKYLKRLTTKDKDGNNYQSQYFTIIRGRKESLIKLMPSYLKEYITEFNYLFHQIYRCASANPENGSDIDAFYNYGNNARKFLETLLFYKYPCVDKKDKDEEKKLRKFLGEGIATTLLNRITNELSHLNGTLERGATVPDVPEISKSAKLILSKIRDSDKDQFSSLLKSIGVSDEEANKVLGE